MRSNIRRSIVVAAAATGLWALGSVAANAAELPAAPHLPAAGTVTDATGKLPTGDVTGTVTKTVGGATQAVQKTAGDVTGGGLPTGKLGDVTGAVGGVQKLVGNAGLPGANA